MFRLLWIFAALILLACEQAPSTPADPGEQELGRVEVIYPHLAPSGAYVLEYQLTADTVFVDYLEAKALVDADPSWQAALTTRGQVFFDNGQGCMYTREVQGCLPFKDEPPLR